MLFSHSVVSDSLRPHGPQHGQLLCPPPSPKDCSNSCSLSQWCYPTISSSAASFSWPQSFPASGSFPVNELFESGGLSIGASTSASVFSMNIRSWFPLGLTGLISLLSKSSMLHGALKKFFFLYLSFDCAGSFLQAFSYCSLWALGLTGFISCDVQP